MTACESDVLRAIRNAAGPTTQEALAKAAGCSTKTVARALRSLEAAGRVAVDGGQGKVATVQLQTFEASDAECPKPGDEYTPLSDAAEAWRARMVWCFRRGRGLPQWRTEGAMIAGREIAEVAT